MAGPRYRPTPGFGSEISYTESRIAKYLGRKQTVAEFMICTSLPKCAYAQTWVAAQRISSLFVSCRLVASREILPRASASQCTLSGKVPAVNDAAAGFVGCASEKRLGQSLYTDTALERKPTAA